MTKIERELGYEFSDPSVLETALTHSSYANEHTCGGFNERLEYLGDAVLELCVSEALYNAHPDWDEGRLTSERSELVRESALARIARELGIDSELRLSRGMEMHGGRQNESVLADAAEALFGAIFLDGGFDRARSIILRCAVRGRHDVRAKSESVLPDRVKDPKTELQELYQASGKKPPKYEVVERTGPDHAPSFAVRVVDHSGAPVATGRGKSKKAAEFAAASEALAIFESEGLRR